MLLFYNNNSFRLNVEYSIVETVIFLFQWAFALLYCKIICFNVNNVSVVFLLLNCLCLKGTSIYFDKAHCYIFRKNTQHLLFPYLYYCIINVNSDLSVKYYYLHSICLLSVCHNDNFKYRNCLDILLFQFNSLLFNRLPVTRCVYWI